MASKSSFLPRLSFSRGETPLFPLHHRQQQQHPLRTKTSEYDLDDLSPHVEEDALLSPDPEAARRHAPRAPFDRRTSSPRTPRLLSSPDGDDGDGRSTPGSTSKMKQPRVLFAGPPPPIVKSTPFFPEEEYRRATPQRRSDELSTPDRNPVASILFSRTSPGSRSSTAATAAPTAAFTPDSVWRSFLNREKALQTDLQHLLDVQAAGLSGGLGRQPDPSPGLGLASETASVSSTPTGTTFYSSHSRLATERSTSAGEVIPVRQPRPKKIGLRGARSGLARTMALLADLKAEEDASLASALSARKRALAQLRKLSARRDGIAEELRLLEADDEEPLARELRDLGDEHGDICAKISDMEEWLVKLKRRRRVVEEKMQDVSNRRESGLSGYRGALKEVEGQLAAVLSRPPVRPLDVEALGAAEKAPAQEVNNNAGEPPLEGLEFLRLRPERRTAGMAKDWWEGEVGLIERRKIEVDKERTALEDGEEVWKEAMQLVSEFEAGLLKQVRGSEDPAASTAKGKLVAPSPEEMMRSQLAGMRAVITGLEQRLRIVEDKSWNLLICAIGAELEAFREAESMLRDSLASAGIEVDEDITPRLGRSVSDTQAKAAAAVANGPDDAVALVDTSEDREVAGDSDNEVPLDLMVTHEDQHGHDDLLQEANHHHDLLQEADHRPSNEEQERDSGENDVPAEFLAEHREAEADEV